MIKPAVSLLLLALLPLPAAAQQRGQAPAAAPGTHEYAGPAEEKISQTSHTVRLDGRDIKYTATTGTLPIRRDDGKVRRACSSSRTRRTARTRRRGRSRSSTTAVRAPRRSGCTWDRSRPSTCRWPTRASSRRRPITLVDNENSLIDVTDLVFVDAIDTGYSRTVAGVNTAQFHGQQGDIRAFGEFINE